MPNVSEMQEQIKTLKKQCNEYRLGQIAEIEAHHETRDELVRKCDKLEKQNQYVSMWMDKYHEIEARCAELENYNRRLVEENVILNNKEVDLNVKVNRYREALESQADIYCTDCEFGKGGACKDINCEHLPVKIALTEGKE